MHSMNTSMPDRDGAVLERPDHLEPGPVADVGEPRVRVPAERPLEDPAVARPVEDRAPPLELAHPVRRLLRVELGHPRVVEELAADHRVAEVGLPGVLGATWPSAAATPPSAMTVWALPRSDLQTRPTVAPAALASIAARRPAPPAPMTSTS